MEWLCKTWYTIWICRIKSEDIEQVLKSFTETEERLAEYTKMLAAQLERFEDESKEMLREVLCIGILWIGVSYVSMLVEWRQGSFVERLFTKKYERIDFKFSYIQRKMGTFNGYATQRENGKQIGLFVTS